MYMLGTHEPIPENSLYCLRTNLLSERAEIVGIVAKWLPSVVGHCLCCRGTTNSTTSSNTGNRVNY